MFRLDGKVALVTGGSRGIGRGCAEALAECGAKVLVNFVNGEAAAREVVDGIVARGGAAEAVRFDVANVKETETAIEAAIRSHGKLDILVANAGIAIDGLLLRLKDDDYAKIFDVNVRGALVCAKLATKSMMRAKWGRVIFVSSIVAEMGNAGQTAYSASKAAVVGAAKSIAHEFASRNITVNVISPGFIDTDMTSSMPAPVRERLLQTIPLGRTGAAKDIGSAAVYLASDEANYVTGQVLRVNGGLYM